MSVSRFVSLLSASHETVDAASLRPRIIRPTPRIRYVNAKDRREDWESGNILEVREECSGWLLTFMPEVIGPDVFLGHLGNRLNHNATLNVYASDSRVSPSILMIGIFRLLPSLLKMESSQEMFNFNQLLGIIHI